MLSGKTNKQKNYKVHQKAKDTFEETAQASFPDVAGMLELSDWEFK